MIEVVEKEEKERNEEEEKRRKWNVGRDGAIHTIVCHKCD